MDEGGNFEFHDILDATQTLKAELRTALVACDDAKVVELVGDLDEVKIVGDSNDVPPLTIAFVGQYNAGKSTILRVLTGRDEITIHSNVCTDKVTAYDWSGVRLLDTPGIKAGFSDHDEKTYAAIDQADLLVFVITGELFDDTIGRHFRELAFARQNARRMLLVVNKMGQDSGTPETKRSDIEKVTAPMTAADFKTSFIDARSWLDAQEASGQDCEDLLEIANIPEVIGALNAFVIEQGLTGRLSSPLIVLRGVAEQAQALVSAEFPEERAALELLHRKRNIFLTSKSRVRRAIEGVIGKAVVDIGQYGDRVAEAIEPGKTQGDIERKDVEAQDRVSQRCNALSLEVSKCIDAEVNEVERQLEALSEGVLARELRGRAYGSTADDAGVSFQSFNSPAFKAHPQVRGLSDWPSKAQKIGDVASKIGKWAGKWATGTKTATAGSLASASGSGAHQAVYSTGKFFGASFKPYGAVKVARAIGVAGKVIAIAGPILAVVGQIAEDRQQEQQRIQLRDARDGIRAAYRESADAVRAETWKQFEAFMADFYDSELSAIEVVAADLVGKRSERGAGAEMFRALGARAAMLIDRVIGLGGASEQAAA